MDRNWDPLVPRVMTAAQLAAATGYPNEFIWTSDTFKLYVEQGGVIKLVGEPDFVKLSGSTMAGDLTLPNTGLHILDTNASHDLIIKPGSDLSADRIFTLTTGDAARTLTLSGNPTLDDWFDQAVKTTSSVHFNDAHIVQATLGSEVLRLESTATNTDPNWSVIQARVATTDATPTLIWSETVPTNMVSQYEARVIARDTSGGSGLSAGYIIVMTFASDGGATYYIGGSTLYSKEADAAWVCEIYFDGADQVGFRVTGKAATNITWHATIFKQVVGT